jgi:hypothetical protein
LRLSRVSTIDYVEATPREKFAWLLCLIGRLMFVGGHFENQEPC